MKRAKLNAEIIFSFALTLFAGYLIFVSYRYGLWKDIAPAKGFMPFVASVLLAISSLVWLLQSVKSVRSGDEEAIKHQFTGNEWKWIGIVGGMCLAVVLLLEYLGMYACLAIFLFIWFKFIDKFSWKRTIISTVVVVGLLYLIFTVGLRVPFPKFRLFK